MGQPGLDPVAAQRRVDAFNGLIAELTTLRNDFMDEYGRCDRWLDGHSYLKCRRLQRHDGKCSP